MSDLLQTAENKLGSLVAGAKAEVSQFIHTAGQDLDGVLSEIKPTIAKLESLASSHRATQAANSESISALTAKHNAEIAELTTANGNLETEALHIESVVIALKAAV